MQVRRPVIKVHQIPGIYLCARWALQRSEILAMLLRVLRIKPFTVHASWPTVAAALSRIRAGTECASAIKIH